MIRRIGWTLLVLGLILAASLSIYTPATAQTAKLVITPEGGNTTAGIAFTITVTAYDGSDNVDTTYTGTIHFESSDPNATLPDDYTFTPSDNGSHTFVDAIILRTAGNQTITVTDTTNSPLTDTQIWTVSSASAARLEITGSPTMNAGTSNELTITARDAFGNIAVSYSGLKSLTFSGPATAPGGQIPTVENVSIGSPTLVNFSSGISDANAATLIAYKAETTTVNVSDGTINSTGHGLSLTVSPASAASIKLTPSGGSTIAGIAFSVTVTAYDAYNNIAKDYLGTIRFTSTDAASTLPPNYTFTPSDNGSRTFTNAIILRTAGNQTITITDTINSSLTDTQTWIVNASASVHYIVISPASATITAGSTQSFTAEAFDQWNNLIGNVTSSTTFSIDPAAGGSWSGNTYTSAKAGTWTVTGTYNTLSDTATLTVTSPAVISYYKVTCSSYTQKVGVPFEVTVTAYDQFNNIVDDSSTMVEMASNYPGYVVFDANGDGLFIDRFKALTNGTFTILVKCNREVTDLIIYASSSEDVYGASLAFTITVGTTPVNPPINTPPVAVDDAYDVNRDALLNIAAPGVLGNDNDADGNSLTAVLVSGVKYGKLTFYQNGAFRYEPDSGFAGIDSFTYKANDGTADSNIATVTIHVKQTSPTTISRGTSPWVWVGSTLVALLLGAILYLYWRRDHAKSSKLDSVSALKSRMSKLDQRQNRK